jgi:predicted nucleic acid-binding protein
VTIHYLDASVWVKRYFKEAGSDRVHQLFQDRQPLASSSLGRVEVVAAIARQSSSRRIDNQSRTLIDSQLDREWGLFLQADAAPGDFVSAVDLARKYALRGADAIHLAVVRRLTQEFGTAGDRLVFQTADDELIVAARKAGLTVDNPLTH